MNNEIERGSRAFVLQPIGERQTRLVVSIRVEESFAKKSKNLAAPALEKASAA